MRPGIGKLLHHHHVKEEIGPGPAVFLGRIRAQVPGFAHLPPSGRVANSLFVPVANMRNDFRVGEAPELLAKMFVLVAENFSSHGLASVLWRFW